MDLKYYSFKMNEKIITFVFAQVRGEDPIFPSSSDKTDLPCFLILIGVGIVIFLWCAITSESKDKKSRRVSSLYSARTQEGYSSKLKSILDSGCDPDTTQDKGDRTPLSYEVGKRKPNIETILMLLKAGANVNARDRQDMTPLMWAANSSTPEVISILLKAGADVNAATWEHSKARIKPPQKSVLTMAVVNNPNPEVISLLLDAGANINYRPWSNGMTILMSAIGQGDRLQNRNPEIISLLINRGADVNASALESGFTALVLAKQKKELQGTQILRDLEEAAVN